MKSISVFFNEYFEIFTFLLVTHTYANALVIPMKIFDKQMNEILVFFYPIWNLIRFGVVCLFSIFDISFEITIISPKLCVYNTHCFVKSENDVLECV